MRRRAAPDHYVNEQLIAVIDDRIAGAERFHTRGRSFVEPREFCGLRAHAHVTASGTRKKCIARAYKRIGGAVEHVLQLDGQAQDLIERCTVARVFRVWWVVDEKHDASV